MKIKSWIIIVAVVLIMILGIVITIIVETRKENNVNHFVFPSTILSENHTTERRADTLAMIIINKIFQFDTINVMIFYMPKEYNDDETEFIGFVQKNPFKSHAYFIFIKKGMLPISIKKILSHEMIHVEQMEKGDLIPIFDVPKMVYKGDTIDFYNVPYDKRPFEISAFAMQDGIEKRLKELLYKK
jgi:hypothetical protein